MGRFATLNSETKDLVLAMLPAIATAFKVDNVVDIIPEDIRMRAWDCDRRDHIKDKTEDDPRNWGVQFLRDLMTIGRLKEGNLTEFQADLRAKVEKHEPKHPWCRLADIKELKAKYVNPDRASEDNHSQDEYASDEPSSTDSYLEELVEQEVPKGKKRRRNHEAYEARVQEKSKHHKHRTSSSRLRRDSEGWERPEKRGRPGKGRYSTERRIPDASRLSVRRPSIAIKSEREGSYDSTSVMSVLPAFTPPFTASPRPVPAHNYSHHSIDNSNEPLAVQKLQAELDVAEAELKAARVRLQYMEAKEKAIAEVNRNGAGTQDEPHEVD